MSRALLLPVACAAPCALVRGEVVVGYPPGYQDVGATVAGLRRPIGP